MIIKGKVNNEIRTHDTQSHNLTLYHLSYTHHMPTDRITEQRQIRLLREAQ